MSLNQYTILYFLHEVAIAYFVSARMEITKTITKCRVCMKIYSSSRSFSFSRLIQVRHLVFDGEHPRILFHSLNGEFLQHSKSFSHTQ